jgi:hypothetical protein
MCIRDSTLPGLSLYGDLALALSGQSEVLLDHLVLGGAHESRTGTLDASLRVLGRFLWPSEVGALPERTNAGTRLAADASWSGKMRWHEFSPRLSLGVVAGNDGLSPVATGEVGAQRLRPQRRLSRLFLAYRFEAGWMSAHLLVAEMDLRLGQRVRLLLWQEAGVRLVLPAHQILPTGATRATLAGRLTGHLEIHGSLYGLYGLAGNGLRAELTLAYRY